MGKNHISNLLQFCQNLYNELEMLNTVIVITQNYFLNKENSGQYYDASQEISLYISKERNNCINMLSILLEKAIMAKSRCETLEDEIQLHNDTNNCR